MQTTNYPVQERNTELLALFVSLGYNAKLVGNPNQPKIIIDNNFAISGYVHNRLYHFVSKPFGGEIVRTISLTVDNPITREDVDALIASTEARPIWKLVVHNEEGPNMYYTKTENFKPYFSTEDSRFFFDSDKAEDTIEYLKERFGIICWLETF